MHDFIRLKQTDALDDFMWMRKLMVNTNCSYYDKKLFYQTDRGKNDLPGFFWIYSLISAFLSLSVFCLKPVTCDFLETPSVTLLNKYYGILVKQQSWPHFENKTFAQFKSMKDGLLCSSSRSRISISKVGDAQLLNPQMGF